MIAGMSDNRQGPVTIVITDDIVGCSVLLGIEGRPWNSECGACSLLAPLSSSRSNMFWLEIQGLRQGRE